jgi:glycosyltransferase involved in cell wall biosynthesis
MHIIHITPTYFDEDSVIGGGERYVHELARFQAKVPDIRVSVVSFGQRRKSFVKDGVHYLIFKALHGRYFTLNNPFSLGHLSALRKADVIHIHQLCTFVSDLAAMTGRFWRIPVIGIDHGGGGAWVLNTRLPVYRCYHRVVAQSQQAMKPLLRHFEGRIAVIPGGVDLGRFTPANVEAEGRKEILFVGRLLPHKGIHTLIEAFRMLKSENHALRIIGRVGNPAYFDTLRKLADDLAVRFETECSDEAIVDAYRRATVTVIPSVGRKDGEPAPELMGFTVLESQACGTPVICSDAGPMREFVREGETGWVFPAGEVKALAECFMKALPIMELKGKASSEACRSHAGAYSWESVSDAYIQLYTTEGRNLK